MAYYTCGMGTSPDFAFAERTAGRVDERLENAHTLAGG